MTVRVNNGTPCIVVAMHLLTLLASVVMADNVPCRTPLSVIAPIVQKESKLESAWHNFGSSKTGIAFIDETSLEVVLFGFTESELEDAEIKFDTCKNFPNVFRLGFYADLNGVPEWLSHDQTSLSVCSPKTTGLCREQALTPLAKNTGKYIFVGNPVGFEAKLDKAQIEAAISARLLSARRQLFRAFQLDTWTSASRLKKQTKNVTDFCTDEALFAIQAERSTLKRFLNRLPFNDAGLYSELAAELIDFRSRLSALTSGETCERFVAESESLEGPAQYFESMTSLSLGRQTMDSIIAEWNATYELAADQNKFSGSGAFVSYLLEKLDGEHVWQNEIQDGILPIDLLRGLVKNGNLSQARIARVHAARAADLNGSYQITSIVKRRSRLDFNVTLQVAYSESGDKLQLQAHIEIVRGRRLKKQRFTADCGGEATIAIGALEPGRGQTFTIPARCSVHEGEGLFPQMQVSIPETLFSQESGSGVVGLVQLDQTKGIPATISRVSRRSGTR